MYKLSIFTILVVGSIILLLHPSRYLTSAAQTAQVAKPTPAQESPSELVEKGERNRQESAAYTTDDRLKYTKAGTGRMTDEARRLGKDVTFLTEDSFTVLPQAPEPPAKELPNQSVLAIRGYVSRKQSFLTDNETAIFTEYEVTVSEVFKSDSGTEPGDVVFITKPGGALKYEGHVLNDHHSRYLPIEPGEDCLFFVKQGNVRNTYSLYQAISIHGDELRSQVFGPASVDALTVEEALARIRSALEESDQK
jgi:hypothetical protein